MTMPLTPSAQKVQDALNALGLTLEVREFSQTTRTSAEAAAAIGCDAAQIAKSLVFKGTQSGKPILVIASGANRVSEKRIAELIGEPIERPDADFVRARTGFVIGGVPPLGHAEPLETLIDEDLFQFSEIWAAAGTPNAVFRLTPADLPRMTNGRVVNVKA
jgi:prolyl-tRNA editing enzyme YbaK/EbsC (Cys-tRNA(Pro) deacylase)